MNYSNSASGLAAGISAGWAIVSFALAIFGIVCMWRVFVKAGEAGWKSLIPIYNTYVFFKISWEAKYFVISLVAIIAAAFLSGVGIGSDSSALAGIGGFLLIIAYVAIIVLAIIANVKLAKRFGKSGGFAVGLILLSIVFMGILAFDDSDYDRIRA